MRTRLYTLGLALLVAGLLVAAAPTGSASAWGNVHCVKHGETLYGIAAMYGTSASAIAHENGLWNPNYVRAGQCLTIPSYGGYDGGHGYGHGYDAGYGNGGYNAGYGWGYGHDGYGAGYGWGNGYGHNAGYGHGYNGKGGNVHCLKYGETLYGLAWQNGVSVWSIAQANGIANPNYVRAGQCLRIPSY